MYHFVYIWGTFCVPMGYILCTYGVHFVYIRDTFCVHMGYILCAYGVHFVYTRGTFYIPQVLATLNVHNRGGGKNYL